MRTRVTAMAAALNNRSEPGHVNSLSWPDGSDPGDRQDRLMKTSLLQSNPWLREPGQRAELLRVSAASSSAVEGIVMPFRVKATLSVTRPARKRAKRFGPTRG